MGKTVRNRQGSQRLREAADELSGLVAKVGFFETSKYPDGTPVAAVAVTQERGSVRKNIPARPFMSTTVDKHRAEWNEQVRRGANAIAEGRFTGAQVMDAIGALAAGDIRKTISEIQQPPLKEATVAARKRRYKDKKTVGSLTKPLVDTAVMVNAVTYAVEKKAP